MELDKRIERLHGVRTAQRRARLFAAVRGMATCAGVAQRCAAAVDAAAAALAVEATGYPQEADCGPCVISALSAGQLQLVVSVRYCDRAAGIDVYLRSGDDAPWQIAWQTPGWHRPARGDPAALAQLRQRLSLGDGDDRTLLAMLFMSAAAGSPMCLYAALLALDTFSGEWAMLPCQASSGAEDNDDDDDEQAGTWWHSIDLSGWRDTPRSPCSDCGCNVDVMGYCLGDACSNNGQLSLLAWP